ncbi:PEGA domain-containing protein [Candidatus Saccharibacteria bacterium]|nr:PEGA domain-containing protein [Candidatus Saccharibacteria bacterium]
MDFLDPRHRKAHRRRLFIGYVLMSIVVGIGTLIVLYQAYGYDIDRKGGGLIQNGIVFVDSNPAGASIYVNDVRQGRRTDTRMVLPAGVYTLRLEADGYRTWERTFSLEGGQIQRIVYPYLIPNELIISDVIRYEALPSLATQSPDRRWVMIQKPGQLYQFDLFDLADPAKPPAVITLPVSIITSPSAQATLKFVEWSGDNRHVLIERQYEGKTEFIMFDHENTSESLNINTTLGIAPISLSLRNKQWEQIYFLDAIPGTLRSGDLRARTISAPLVLGVITYRTSGNDIILYATQTDVEAGQTEFRIMEAGVIYKLKVVNQSDAYVLDVSRYEKRWYYVVGSASDNMAFVYENPLPALKPGAKTPLIISGILRIDNPRFASFSDNTQYFAVQSGSEIVTINLEDDRQYRLKLKHDIPVNQKIDWMDGHRFLYVVDGQSFIVDFDGSNEETLVTMLASVEPFFDRDFNNVYTLEPSKLDASKSALTVTKIDLAQ